MAPPRQFPEFKGEGSRRRWAYCIDRSTPPLAKAQLESTELEDHGSGTRVRWTLATHPGILLWVTAPFFRSTVQRLQNRAMRNLEARAARPS